jgi:hypothetical protein
VTIELFRGALKKTMGKKMDEAEIDRIAEFVMGLFGFDMSVIDNMLSTSDRDVFYMLEEARLLRTTRDEVTIAKGKIWRIHYWILNEEKIIELNEPDPPVVKNRRRGLAALRGRPGRFSPHMPLITPLSLSINIIYQGPHGNPRPQPIYPPLNNPGTPAGHDPGDRAWH